MTRFLLALLTDAVLESATAARRAFAAEMDRYFEERGLTNPRAPRPKAR